MTEPTLTVERVHDTLYKAKYDGIEMDVELTPSGHLFRIVNTTRQFMTPTFIDLLMQEIALQSNPS